MRHPAACTQKRHPAEFANAVSPVPCRIKAPSASSAKIQTSVQSVNVKPLESLKIRGIYQVIYGSMPRRRRPARRPGRWASRS
jgi:hypothetical protein